MVSPYHGLSEEKWADKTRELIGLHPLDPQEIYDIVIQVWQEIFNSNLTSRNYRIGVDIFPRPQIMGYFLHELIPLELSSRYPDTWRREENENEKDIFCLRNDYFSVEIKTSSSSRNTYGNRSYTQASSTGKTKKSKSGYYLVINFQKFDKNVKGIQKPKINLVRFGWLDEEDWQDQTASTGQQARLSPSVERYKLLELPDLK